MISQIFRVFQNNFQDKVFARDLTIKMHVEVSRKICHCTFRFLQFDFTIFFFFLEKNRLSLTINLTEVLDFSLMIWVRISKIDAYLSSCTEVRRFWTIEIRSAFFLSFNGRHSVEIVPNCSHQFFAKIS